MQENEIAGKIRDVVLYGSRSRGIEDSEKADIDILVEVDGADMKEYALFNFFDELFLEVDGIPVDINPIRPEQTGTLEDFLPTAEEYLEQQKAEKAKKKILSSDGKQEQEELPKTLEQENSQNANVETVDEQDVVQYTVNFVTQSETYIGGYDSDGHERLDNYSLQQDETSFRIYTDYVSKYDSNLPYGYYDIGTEQAIEEIESLFDKSIHDFEATMQITDKDNKPVSVNDVLSYLKERAVSEQEKLTDKTIIEKNKEIIDSLTVGSQIILGENSWKVTHINGDFSANLENLDKNSKMSDLSYMGFWKESLLDEAKDQPIIVITPEEEKVEQPKEEQAEVKTPLSREELIEKAKSIINDFVNEEYDDTKGADFSNLTKIDVAYTTTEDEKHTIQAYIDLEHLNIVKEVDGHILEKESYDSLEKLVDDLNSLDFSDLTSISDEQLEKLEQENLTDKDEQPKRINADDIKIGDKFEYKGRGYEVTHLTGVYPDDVGVSYIEKMAGGLTYQLTSNIDKSRQQSAGRKTV